MNWESLRPFAETDRQREILDALAASKTQREAAKKVGIADGTMAAAVARIKRNAERRGWSPDFDQTNACPETQYIKGVSTQYDSAGNVLTQWVKTNARQEAMREALIAFAAGLASEVKPAKPRRKSPKLTSSDLATHYKLGDQHFGMYAWARETGTDWDTDKSVDAMRAAVDWLADHSPATETGVLVNMGDLCHINDRSNKTPASGNLLDVDTRFPKVVEAIEQGLVFAVERLLGKHPMVEVINAQGNHDPDIAVMVNMLLKAHYKNEPRVAILDNASYWQAWEFGETVVFVNHGEKKRAHQHEYLSSRFANLWPRKYKYVDNGHIHHKQAEEIGGVMFESWNTLAPADAYHARSGYNAQRSMSSVTYHKNCGEVGRHRFDMRIIEGEK